MIFIEMRLSLLKFSWNCAKTVVENCEKKMLKVIEKLEYSKNAFCEILNVTYGKRTLKLFFLIRKNVCFSFSAFLKTHLYYSLHGSSCAEMLLKID